MGRNWRHMRTVRAKSGASQPARDLSIETPRTTPLYLCPAAHSAAGTCDRPIGVTDKIASAGGGGMNTEYHAQG